jgi:glycosyltransferase involved in cell wall biosynthesis
MRVLWTHNFNPLKLNAGCFMHTALRGLRDIGVDVQLEYLGNLRSPFEIMSSRKRIRALSRKFDVVHAQYGSACAWVTSGIRDKPLCVTLRGSDFNIAKNLGIMMEFHNHFARALTKSVLNKFSMVCAISHKMASELSDLGLNKKLIVMPSPIDLDLWKPKSCEHQVNDSSRTKNVLFTSINIGNQNKRYSLCKQAIELASHQMGDVRLKIATGIHHQDMPKFVATCDAVLCTSISEGWPNSVKEALACNVPFVATDVSDLAGIASREPSCRVCKPDPELLAKALCEVLQAPPPLNLRRHVEHMDLKASSKRLSEIYKLMVHS